MNYFTNEQTFEQYYTNNCQTLTLLRMNTQEITTYVTNPAITIQEKGEYLEWQLFDCLTKMALPRQKLHTKTNLVISKVMEELIYSQHD